MEWGRTGGVFTTSRVLRRADLDIQKAFEAVALSVGQKTEISGQQGQEQREGLGDASLICTLVGASWAGVKSQGLWRAIIREVIQVLSEGRADMAAEGDDGVHSQSTGWGRSCRSRSRAECVGDDGGGRA